MRILIACLVAAAALTSPLAAQPFLSDQRGPVVTGSELAGMGFRDLENAIFGRSNNQIVFRSRAVANAVRAQAAVVCAQLAGDSLAYPRDWPARLRVGPAERDTAFLLLCETESDPAPLLRALRGGAPGVEGDPASVLVRALQGLFVSPEVVQDARGRRVLGDRWRAAFQAYNRYVDQAPMAVLADPPGVLTAIGIALASGLDAGVDAAFR
ncbi:MAG TPA: hypothetical protein VF665_23730 [Longimicrobium sp.]|uniref:hypothetical protein n=1 Tax=Longimicrobium sp. TaxID=2029185 RepID=UPI002EDB97DB